MWDHYFDWDTQSVLAPPSFGPFPSFFCFFFFNRRHQTEGKPSSEYTPWQCCSCKMTDTAFCVFLPLTVGGAPLACSQTLRVCHAAVSQAGGALEGTNAECHSNSFVILLGSLHFRKKMRRRRRPSRGVGVDGDCSGLILRPIE